MAARVHVVRKAADETGSDPRLYEALVKTFVLGISELDTAGSAAGRALERRGGNRFATLTCEVCGRPFEVPHGERNRRKTCGRECGRSWLEPRRPFARPNARHPGG